MQKLKCVLIANFNPRLREGGDTIGLNQERRYKISIHASAKEATVWQVRAVYYY